MCSSDLGVTQPSSSPPPSPVEAWPSTGRLSRVGAAVLIGERRSNLPATEVCDSMKSENSARGSGIEGEPRLRTR